jgi:imidazolonepropionase-like amidohydrolase
MRAWTLIWCLFLAGSANAQTIAIRAGNLIDPAKGVATRNQIILVRDQKIIDVGTDVPIPKDAEVLDLSNSWVMPGIMDAHTHITAGGVKYFWDQNWYLREPTGMRALRGLRMAQTLLNAGITTVRDAGNDGNFAAVDLRRAINAGWFVGPTIQTAGKALAPFGGQNKDTPQEIGPIWQFEYYDANGPEEIRKAVREDIYYGADFIKIIADNGDYHYSVEEIRAAVDEAHHAGRTVAVHVRGGEAAQNVIVGGADSVEHGYFLSDDQLRLMKERGVFLSSTDFPTAHLVAGEFPDAKNFGAALVDRLRRAYRIGVKIGFSTDIVTDLPNETRADMSWDYLAVWRAAGVPAAEILKSMTTINAELLKIEKERGTVAAGFYADIVAMSQNPLDDIEALRQINFVMKNGMIVRRPN